MLMVSPPSFIQTLANVLHSTVNAFCQQFKETSFQYQHNFNRYSCLYIHFLILFSYFYLTFFFLNRFHILKYMYM